MNRLRLDSDVLLNLDAARKSYGNKNQILVCMEELNELACVLAKYPRYADETKAIQELHDKVLDEVADVMVILNHVQNIFGLSDVEINERIYAKINRLRRWLLHSNSMQETVDDRTVESSVCSNCKHNKNITDESYDSFCKPCHQAQATEGIAPFYEGEE